MDEHKGDEGKLGIIKDKPDLHDNKKCEKLRGPNIKPVKLIGRDGVIQLDRNNPDHRYLFED